MPDQIIGAESRISYVTETVAGTTPAVPSMKQLKAATYGESLGGNMGKIVSNAINASRAREDVRGGRIPVSGSVPVEIAPLGLGSILYHALGVKSVTGAGPYTHVLKRGALPAGMTIEKWFTAMGKGFAFRGIRIDKLALNINADDSLVTGSIDVHGMGFEQIDATLGVPAALAHDPFAQFECAFEEDGVGIEVLNFAANIMNGLDPKGHIGTRFNSRITAGVGDADGTLTMRFESMDHYNKWINESEHAIELTATAGAMSIAFLYPQVKFFGQGIPPISTDKGLVVERQFTAVRNAAEGTDVKITIVNTEATIV